MNKKYPEPVVGVLVINPKGEILLVKSHKWKNKYSLIGGHIEIGETIEDAIKRETREETGLKINKIEFICFQEALPKKYFYKKKHFIFLDFACKIKYYKKIKLNSENQEYIWIDPKKALNLSLNRYTKITLKTYLKK